MRRLNIETLENRELKTVDIGLGLEIVDDDATSGFDITTDSGDRMATGMNPTTPHFFKHNF